MNNMPKKNRKLLITANILIYFFTILFTVSGVIDISIKNATPLIIIPLVTAFSIFNSVGKSAFAGFFVGAGLDSLQVGTYCFNTIIFMIIGVLVYLIANNLFNKNIQSAITLSVIMSLFYFGAKWLIFFFFGLSAKDSMTYLLSYAFPSAMYSAVFILPLFYLYRYFDKLANE